MNHLVTRTLKSLQTTEIWLLTVNHEAYAYTSFMHIIVHVSAMLMRYKFSFHFDVFHNLISKFFIQNTKNNFFFYTSFRGAINNYKGGSDAIGNESPKCCFEVIVFFTHIYTSCGVENASKEPLWDLCCTFLPNIIFCSQEVLKITRHVRELYVFGQDR